MSIYQNNPNIDVIKVRAKILFGKVGTLSSVYYLLAETPYIQNFNVNKQRGRYSTFTASIKIKADQLDQITEYIVIKAGEEGSIKTIFTGKVKRIVPNPAWDDPTYIIVNLSGSDALADLEDKKIVRRQTDSNNAWASIDSVVSRAPKDVAFKFKKQKTLISTTGSIEKNQDFIGNENISYPNRPRNSIGPGSDGINFDMRFANVA